MSKTSTHQICSHSIARPEKKTAALKCISCGSELKRPRRRYCSDECRHKINWVLSLSKGLLKTFSTRYAAFSFTNSFVMLDVLPTWSNVISRFIRARNNGNTPAEDLKSLVLNSGKQWYELVDNKRSRSHASLLLLDRYHNKEIDPASIKPIRKIVPKLSAQENSCLKILQLNRETLCAKENNLRINSAYRKMAKVHHPDLGGDAEKFKALNEAHKQMLSWAANPLYREAKGALQDCWSYNAYTNKWTPPL